MPADSSLLVSPERKVSAPLDVTPESGDRIRALAAAQAGLAERLETLERLVRRLRSGRAETTDAARLSKLQEAVADLAAAQYDTRQQLDLLAGAVDQLATEHLEDAPGDEQTGGAVFIPPTMPRGWRPRLKRWARLILRSTVGKARWIWDSTHPRPPWGGDVRLEMTKAPARLPSLTVVTGSAGSDARDAPSIEAWLERQTGREGIEIRGGETGLTIETDYVWNVGSGAADQPATFLESARLLLATEALGFVCFEATEGGATQWLVAKELRGTDGRLDLRVLSRQAKRYPGRVLGKIVGGDDKPDLLPQLLCHPDIRRRVRRSGPYVVAVATKPRLIKHRLSLPRPDTRPPQTEPRPAVVILLTAPLAGGVERFMATLLKDLADDTRTIIATTVPQSPWGTRWRALERSTPFVYALGGVFAKELHANVVQELIARHGVRRLLHVGAGESWPRIAGLLRNHLPELRVVNLDLATATATPLPSAADIHLASGATAEEALLASGIAPDRVLRLRPIVDLEPGVAHANASERLRRELGWPTGAFVVVMCADLIAEQRPEDFVALAHRFFDDPRFRFLLIADGPLSADLRDLARLFGLTNLHIERPEHELAAVLDAADVVCTTAERDPFPSTVLAALLRRRPVVAAAIDDLSRLLETGPCGIVVPHPGDLYGFETALRSLAQEDQARELGENGPEAVRDVYGTDSTGQGSPPNNAWRQALDLSGS